MSKPEARMLEWRSLFGWFGLWAFLSVLSWQIPPLQSPDEVQHLGRAASLSEGHWRLQHQAGEPSRTVLDTSLAVLTGPYLALAVDAQRRLTEAEQRDMQALGWSGETISVVLPGAGYYLPVVYAPAAFGLMLGRTLGLGVLDSYRLAKALNLAVLMLMVVAAYRTWRPPALAWVLLTLPMTLFQAAAPVPDGLASALTLWVLSLFMRIWHDESHAKQDRVVQRAALLAALLVVLVGCRPHMLPLLALPWLLCLASQKDNSSKALLLGAMVCSLLSLAWWAQALDSTVDPRVQRSLSTSEIAAWYASEPERLLAVLMRTFSDLELLHFYRDSFLGILGWLDTRLADWVYPALAWGLVAMVILSATERVLVEARYRPSAAASSRRGLLRSLLLLGVGLACVMLVFAATLLSWSPHPASVIEGVQGRYFLGPAMVLTYAGCSNTQWNQNSKIQRTASAGALGLMLLSIGALIQAVAARYH